MNRYDLAAGGYHVHPLRPGKKAPATEHGFKDATTDPDVIAGWPSGNTGIALAPSGVLVIGPDSEEWRAEFEQAGLPDTMIVETGSGHGWHYYYRLPDGCPLERDCNPGKYDIMSDGYVVAGGSVTAYPYRLLTPFRRVDELPLAPAWAVDTLIAHAAERQAKPAPAPIPATSLSFSDQDVLTRMFTSKHGGRVEALYRGDITAHNGIDQSHSGADLALLSAIAFWTQDEAQIERIYMTSGLYRPEKWRGSYRTATLTKALQRSDFYTPTARIQVDNYQLDPCPNGAANLLDNIQEVSPHPCPDLARENEMLRAQLAAVTAERDALRAENTHLRKIESRRAQISKNQKMSEGAKLMLMALIPEIEGVRSGAGGPLDPEQPDRRVSGKAIHVDLTAMSERIGCKPDAAGDRINKLVAAGLFHKTYRPKMRRDPETGKLLQGDGGKEILIEPVYEDLDVLLDESTRAETPGRANQGGKREPRCKNGCTDPLAKQTDVTITCTGCGEIVEQTSTTSTIDPNRQVDVSGDEATDNPPVEDNVLRYVKKPVGATPEANRQIDGLGTCGLCRRPLRNAAERETGCHSYDCLAPYDQQRPPPVPLYAALGDD